MLLLLQRNATGDLSRAEALLAALEKGDAEHMARLRQQQEQHSLTLARDVRFLQWKEAEAATASLVQSRAVVWERYRHYKRILGGDIDAVKTVDVERNVLTEEGFDGAYQELVTRHAAPLEPEAYRKETTVGGVMEFAGNAVVGVFGGELRDNLPLNKNEDAELNIYLPTSDIFSTVSSVIALAAPLLSMIPQFNAEAQPLGVGVSTGFGGVQLSKSTHAVAEINKMTADFFRSGADRAARLSGYYRRAEDYVLQANLATSELEQYGRQIVSSLLREQILKREYDNHLAQIEEVEAQGAFLSDKFTNEELYGWMQGELSKTYYDCYKLAFDLAKRAEQTLKHELMRPELDGLNPIKFGYWDSGRKGLLAGETLSLDLHRLETAYLEHNRREYEMTRHVSLARLDPLALLRLKAEGSCEVTIPEWLFDMDSPGQYMRRLKTVALSIPCVAGPYTGVHCKLSLVRSSIRVSSLAEDQYAYARGEEDGRFRDFAGAIQSIVTSNAQNDAGLFELNLHDERYLPFEGAGAISTWRIELPNETPQFDFETISDLVLHLRYTAREAGHLRAAASAGVTDVLGSPSTLFQLFCLNYDFGNAWTKFTDAASDAKRELSLAIDQDRFPYWVKRLGMDDMIVGTFAVVDQDKRRLAVAPTTLDFAGDANAGWTATVDLNSPVFGFLKKYRTTNVYLAVTYKAS
jgi:hypothetical protein